VRLFLFISADGILKQISKDDIRNKRSIRVSDMSEDDEINIDRDLADQHAMTVFTNYQSLGMRLCTVRLRALSIQVLRNTTFIFLE
jgi:hypothetical protein